MPKKKTVTLTISFTATNSKNKKEIDNKKLNSKINMKQLDNQEYENIKLHLHISFNKQFHPQQHTNHGIWVCTDFYLPSTDHVTTTKKPTK